MRDRPNETSGHVAEVNVEVAPARRPPGLRHVLRENLSRSDAFNQHRAEIAYQRRDEILQLQSISRADCRRFLSKRTKHATHNFRLTIKIYKTLFHKPGQFQITIKLQHLVWF